MIYFTSDPHYFHQNIIKYCDRPWGTVGKMHKAFIERWNSVVTSEEDLVYITGDFTMYRKPVQALSDILNALNGRKKLILGNHDKIGPFEYLELGFESVHTSLEMEYAGHNFFLCHDPAWREVVSKDYIVVCGHVHTLFKVHKNCINVGVDVWDYTPISIDTVIDKMSYFYLEGCGNEEINGLETNRK